MFRLSTPIGLLVLVAIRAGAGELTLPDASIAFMKKHCFECHGEKSKKAGVDLLSYKTDASILSDAKVWQTAVQMIETGEMPPEKKPQPDAAEKKAFVSAIQDFFKKAESRRDPGRVTIRRLNRNEYNNTVRDLLNVDFEPAEDFPSDEVGYGFDNIGDVLSLSPVLMERYVAAAEQIAQRSIMVDSPKPVTRWQSTKHVEPGGDYKNKFRSITTKAGAKHHDTGPLYLSYKVPADGEYLFRTRVYATAPAGKTVKLAILASGPQIGSIATDAEMAQLHGNLQNLKPFTILKTFEVKAREEGKAEVFKVEVPVIGVNRMAIALMKPEGEPAKPATVTAPPETKKPEAKKPDAVAAKGDVKPDAKGGARPDANAKPEDAKKDEKPDNKPKTEQPKDDSIALFIEYFNLEGPLDPRPAFQRKFSKPGEALETAKIRSVLSEFATRAYRRPANDKEVDGLVKLVEDVKASGEKVEYGMQLALQAILCSPKFLFRVELDDRPAQKDPLLLDEYQLASRLSYFLWSSMPDNELFELAKKKQLSANIDAQVKRMLADPKSSALVQNFGVQWLQIQRLSTHSPDAKVYNRFNEQLRRAMFRETEMFLSAVIKEDRSILDLIVGDFTYLNETLAKHYGIADTSGNRIGQPAKYPKGKPIPRGEFVRVTVPDGERGGLLTQGSILTVTSNPTRTSPVKRGRWMLDQILGTPPPPPPADVPDLAEAKEGVAVGTLRQRMEQHRENPACASCHARMDPLGFAFENFDGIGAYRLKDENQPIDTSGVLPDGRSFKGPQELKAILKEKKDLFTRCLAEKLLTYSLGRGLKYYDEPALRKIAESVQKQDYKFSVLVSEIVKSDPFRMRRGSETE